MNRSSPRKTGAGMGGHGRPGAQYGGGGGVPTRASAFSVQPGVGFVSGVGVGVGVGIGSGGKVGGLQSRSMHTGMLAPRPNLEVYDSVDMVSSKSMSNLRKQTEKEEKLKKERQLKYLQKIKDSYNHLPKLKPMIELLLKDETDYEKLYYMFCFNEKEHENMINQMNSNNINNNNSNINNPNNPNKKKGDAKESDASKEISYKFKDYMPDDPINLYELNAEDEIQITLNEDDFELDIDGLSHFFAPFTNEIVKPLMDVYYDSTKLLPFEPEKPWPMGRVEEDPIKQIQYQIEENPNYLQEKRNKMRKKAKKKIMHQKNKQRRKERKKLEYARRVKEREKEIAKHKEEKKQERLKAREEAMKRTEKLYEKRRIEKLRKQQGKFDDDVKVGVQGDGVFMTQKTYEQDEKKTEELNNDDDIWGGGNNDLFSKFAKKSGKGDPRKGVAIYNSIKYI